MDNNIILSNFVAGKWVEQYRFKSFMPTNIRGNWTIDNTELALLLCDAAEAVAELKAYCELTPNAADYLPLFTAYDAIMWNRDSGTNITVDEAFMSENELSQRKRKRLSSVKRYVSSFCDASKEMRSSKLSLRVIRTIHKNLMDGKSSGINIIPGMFRVEHLPVGGATLSDAAYVPPHPQEVLNLITEWDYFLADRPVGLHPILKIALAHYQYLTIQPFAGYNGRICRMATSLMFEAEKLIGEPLLFMGEYFETNKTVYHNNLIKVRVDNDLTQWLKFFTVGTLQCAKQTITRLKAIGALRSRLQTQTIPSIATKHNKHDVLLNLLFTKPVVNCKDVITCLDVSMPTVNSIIDSFIKAGILSEITGMKKNRVYLFKEYISIFS